METKFEAQVVSVSLCARHSFSKEVREQIVLVAGLGVEGDAHAGVTVRHRFRVRQDPTAPNLCQVHLLQVELFKELEEKNIGVAPGEMGENITTSGIDLLGLGRGTLLHLGPTAVVEVTGLRDPCAQLNGLRPGLMQACLARDAAARVIRKAGIMGIVIVSGTVRRGHGIEMTQSVGVWRPLHTV